MRRHGSATKTVIRTFLCLVACLDFGGCRHRQAAPTLPAVLKAPDTQPPAPNSPPMESPPPDSVSTAPQIKVSPTKPKRVPAKKTPPKAAADGAAVAATTPPVDGAGNVPTAESSIGALSAGGDATPQTQQDAAGLIVACEQRLHDSSQNTKEQRSSLRKVQYFIKQAKQALGTGDAEGAMTLATKAKLLLDDLSKEAT